jgi:hypothetical protein
MGIFTAVLTILGLSLFEMITSIDNAVINAEVLSGMSQKARRWFMTWGFLFAVVVVRGLLPFIIIWASVPGLSPFQVLGMTFEGSEEAAAAIEKSAPLLLVGGGIFLILLSLNWLFSEPKNFGLVHERILHGKKTLHIISMAFLLTTAVLICLKIDPFMIAGVVVGAIAYFLVHGIKKYAEKKEESLLNNSSAVSDFTKIIYLEVLDATFSIDGVIGAFAFTFSVALILIGNGLGALILRKLTVNNIDRIKKYKFLKNGAMYSIFFLGVIMLLDSFGLTIPAFVSPIITFTTVGYFFYISHQNLSDVERDFESVIEGKNL